MRSPALQQPIQRTRFGLRQQHVVAIEVDAVRVAGGDFAIQGAWCFWDTAASRGYLATTSPGGSGDGGLEATVGKLVGVLLPPKSMQSDLSSKGDYPL